jgi:hypothetical protein
MRLRVRVHEVSGGGRLRRVVVPATPLRDTHLTNLLTYHSGALFSSRADLLRLGALFRLAAISPHSAVFLPLRANVPSEFAASWGRDSGLADLLVVRRDVPLRASAWPAIRARLHHGAHPGRAATMHAPAPREPDPEQPWDWPRHRLSVAEYAGTVIFSATSRGLHEAGDELTWCGNAVAVNIDIHRFGGPAALSQFAGGVWHTGRPEDDWECDILAEDPLFRQNRWIYQPGDGWVTVKSVRPADRPPRTRPPRRRQARRRSSLGPPRPTP